MYKQMQFSIETITITELDPKIGYSSIIGNQNLTHLCTTCYSVASSKSIFQFEITLEVSHIIIDWLRSTAIFF